MNKKTQKIRVLESATTCTPKLLKNKGFIPCNNPLFACTTPIFMYNKDILTKNERTIL